MNQTTNEVARLPEKPIYDIRTEDERELTRDSVAHARLTVADLATVPKDGLFVMVTDPATLAGIQEPIRWLSAFRLGRNWRPGVAPLYFGYSHSIEGAVESLEVMHAARQAEAEAEAMCPSPKVSELDPDSRRRWADVSESKHGGWDLTIHDPWTDDGRARVVLTRAVFMVQFEYPKGDPAAREAARSAAISFAKANPMKRIEIFPMRYWVCPQLVGFSGALQPAGWVTGDVAKVVNGLLDARDEKGLKALFKPVTTYAVENHSTAIFEAISRAGVSDNRALGGTTQPATLAEVRSSLLMADPAKLYMAENLHEQIKACVLKGETRALAIAYAVHSALATETSTAS